MKSIKQKLVNTIVINKSKFMTLLIPIENVTSFKVTLDEIKKEYPGATHYCYAYIIGDQQKYSDDGEPASTAGAPILNVLTKEHLTNLLCVVVRYFGGIKLGVGGLVRAYSKSVKLALKEAEVITITKGFLVTITFDYDNTKAVDFVLRNTIIKNTIYAEDITYNCLVSVDNYLPLKSELDNMVKQIEIKENVFM